MKKSNNQQFEELLKKHNKTRKWAAAVVATNLSTVDRWLVPVKDPDDRRRYNTTHRAMPTSCLSLIRLAAGDMKLDEFLIEVEHRYAKRS